MKIKITPSAVRAEDDTLLFREGTLTALLRLQEKEHRFSIDGASLSAAQLALFRQENIDFKGFNSVEADYIIDALNRGLAVLDHDLEVMYESPDWRGITIFLLGKRRVAERTRKTKETDISIRVDLDGNGKSEIKTGLGFFDHMLEQIARHGFIDLAVNCHGDLHIDEHHTIEDVGIALGECIAEALGDKRGIERYGFVLAMDETVATVAMDLSGRAYLVFEGDLNREKVGDFPTEMTKHFFYSLAIGMKATLNIRFEGENDHHKIEAIFKGFARALKQAVAGNPKSPDEIPSSKGVI